MLCPANPVRIAVVVTIQWTIFTIGFCGAFVAAIIAFMLMRRWAGGVLVCRNCGYLARWLETNVCPECGADSRLRKPIPFGWSIRLRTALAVFAWTTAPAV